jgi:YVTN family beta-propeller protein
MTAPVNPPPKGGRGSRRRPLATALLWIASLGLYWPVWLWRIYRTLHAEERAATGVTPRRAAGLAAIPGLNLLWTAFLAVDLPRAVRRVRHGKAGDAGPDTELLAILLVAPAAAGVALAFVLGLSPLLAILLAGYLAWAFELPAAITVERALGELQPTWETHERRRDIVGAITAGAVCALAIVLITGGEDETRPVPQAKPRAFPDVSDIAVTNDALWITNTVRGTLLKLDPRTRERLSPPIRIGRQPIDVGAREDGVWVANYESGTVVRVDPAANQLTGPIETGRGPFGIAVTRNAVWVTNQVERTVVRIDPRTNKLAGRPVLVGRGPRGVAVGEGAVWVATGEGKGVSRVDPSSRARRARRIPLGRFCHDVAVGGGSVWVTNPNESTVMRIDPDTNRPAGKAVSVPGGPSTIEFGFGSLWVASEAGAVTRINPRTGELTGEPVELGAKVSDLTVGDDAVWVLRGDGKVRRLSPPR